jgi:SAM-dependent methyltransferase
MESELRRTFGEVAELYDRVRPGYATALFSDLFELSQIGRGGRVLEIGCGTGQATLPLLERGLLVTAVELSEDLAGVARRKLAAFGDQVRIDVAPFEAWPLPAEPFDLVVSAQAFHWVDPDIRLRKSADALVPGGALAVFGHTHVKGGDTELFHDIQDCYERFMPGTPPGLRLEDASCIPFEGWSLTASGLFEAPVFRRYAFEVEYTTAAYLDVLNTYSGHRALDSSNREALFECISRLIDQQRGGRIRKAYLTELAVATRR